MDTLVKTTITLPEQLLQQAKLAAIRGKTSVSRIMRDALQKRVATPIKRVKDPMKLLGKFRLGINKIYTKRSDLYDDYLKRKMGL